MLIVQWYSETKRNDWNQFVVDHPDQIFFCHRDFIDYHGERFSDRSVLVCKEDKLIAILPAIHINQKLISHQGLSFGGLYYSPGLKTGMVRKIWSALLSFLKKEHINEVIITYPSSVYHHSHRDDEIYHFLNNGGLIKSSRLTFVIDMTQPVIMNSNRKRIFNKDTSLIVREEQNLSSYFTLLTTLLAKKYKTQPVHTLEEMEYLQSKFPQNIQLVGAYNQEKLVGGILLFVFGQTVKLQYIASNDNGNKMHAITYIVKYILDRYKGEKKYIDMGTAYEDDGSMNEGLVKFKESFGARGATYHKMALQL